MHSPRSVGGATDQALRFCLMAILSSSTVGWPSDGRIENRNLTEIRRLTNVKRADGLVAPGTYWCGDGNKAPGVDDVHRWAPEVDACCRSHDHCPYCITSRTTKDHYHNFDPFSTSDCSCDEQFFDCLKNVKTSPAYAAVIGTIFFDVLQPKCVTKQVGKYCSSWMAYIYCTAEAEGEAAIPFDYLHGKFSTSNSVAEIKRNLGGKLTQVPILGAWSPIGKDAKSMT